MKVLAVITLIIIQAGVCRAATGFAIPVVPNEAKTPGSFCSEEDKDFREFRYEEKIPYCERNVAGWIKNRIYGIYKVPAECRDRYTIDHKIPLALGGSNSMENLWPEHVLVKATRQDLEDALYRQVNHGDITVEEAVEIILKAKTELHLDLSAVDGCG